MSKKIYYKVLSTGRHSYMWEYIDEKCIVSYPIKKWVKPRIKSSSLMVFKSKKHAEDFLRVSCSWSTIIVPCHIEISEVQQPYILPLTYGVKFIRQFWQGNFTPWVDDRKKIPKGTVFADAVYCLE